MLLSQNCFQDVEPLDFVVFWIWKNFKLFCEMMLITQIHLRPSLKFKGTSSSSLCIPQVYD